MNTPPGLLAAACALWGVQTGQFLVALAAAIALEAPRFVALRWNVAQAHFNRISDFCSVLVVAAAGLLYVTYGTPRAVLLLFQWLPLLLIPLALAQAWGSLAAVDVAAFVWTLRKAPASERSSLNLAYPCFAVWLLAAAVSNASGWTFFAGMTLLVAWALWARRPRRYPVALCLGLLAVAGGAGYGMQHGLFVLQEWLVDFVTESIAGSGARTDPYQSRTDLGHIGELKMDDAIVLRVRAPEGYQTPLLLHRATYNGYFSRTWSARNAPLAPRPPAEAARWVLGGAAAPAAAVTVFDHSLRGDPVLSLPRGTAEVRGLAASGIKMNALGTVQAERAPGYFSYVAALDPAAQSEGPPTEEDHKIPAAEQRLFSDLAGKLGTQGLAPRERVAAIARYFSDGFGYSTYQAAGPGGGAALDDFLLRTRAGHCEYFATATALLLRAAGVPARYATGYSTQEYSRLEDAYIVRVRHAHAWARAYVDGRWIDVDTTPGDWVRVEAQGASWWTPLSDLWSWVRFRIAQLTADSDEESRTAAIAIAVALLLAAWFGWRLYTQRALMMYGRRGAAAAPATATPGADSELFLIERELERAGLARAAGETMIAWIARIGGKLPPGKSVADLHEIARLHYRYRFDPLGLRADERARLRERSLAWLELPQP